MRRSKMETCYETDLRPTDRLLSIDLSLLDYFRSTSHRVTDNAYTYIPNTLRHAISALLPYFLSIILSFSFPLSFCIYHIPYFSHRGITPTRPDEI